MRPTDTFRNQHGKLVKIVQEITAQLDDKKLAVNAAPTHNLLSSLAGVLKIHLAAEDQALYPKLISHNDAKIKNLAKQYVTEMGGIKSAFEAYQQRWSSPQKIQANPATFVQETRGVFDVLAKRIYKEDNELYPLLDKAA